MAWQLDQVSAVRAMTNITKRMRRCAEATPWRLSLSSRHSSARCRRHLIGFRSWAAFSGRLGELPMRINDELARDAGVEVFVTFRRPLETDHLDIDDLGDGQSVPEDRLHELPIVLQHRRLAGMERVRLCPAETEAQAEIAVFGCLLLRARIIGHIQAGNADRARGPRDLHQAVEHNSRRLDDVAVRTLCFCFEADAIDRAVD